MKLWVFGDSFSTNKSPESWVSQYAQHLGLDPVFCSHNGISEYRIYRTILEKYDIIDVNDKVIVCHTNPFRVFLSDSVRYPTRKEKTHPHCDLVITDATSKSLKWKFLTSIFFKYFFDEDERLSNYHLLVNEIDRLLTKKVDVLHVSGFEVEKVISFYDIFQEHRGKINHMTELGNSIALARLTGGSNV